MGSRFASDKNALGICDITGFRYKLKDLKKVYRKGEDTGLLAGPDVWDPDQPQLKLGEFRVDDPQALRNPRPDSAERDTSRELTGEQYDDWVAKIP